MRQALDALETRWGLAVQSASFGVWDLDIPADTVHYPPQWKALLGYDDADVAEPTATWRGRVHPDDLQPMLQELCGYLAGDAEGYATEFRLRAADGSYRWVLSRGRVVERDAAGQPLRAVGTLTDLTDRREAEQLRAQRDRAEAESRAKSEFLSRMSHELRTPLNAVLGFAQLMSSPRGQLGPDDQRRYAVQIEQAGWHLLKLIDDVLDLSRIDNGGMALDFGRVALAPLLQAALDSAAPRALRQGVTLAAGTPPPALALRADAVRLQQVLGHLLANAIQYNRRGGEVRVDTTVSGGQCTLTVADTGLGIPAAQLPHLFEPFNRLGRVRTGDGVGIGLALARALVEAMGGRLVLHSTEGVGTTVELSLPVAGDMR